MLENTGANPINWAAGSPDAQGAYFAVTPGTAVQPTLTGRLEASASVTLTVTGLPSGGAHVVVIADGGTVEFKLGGCS
jgi:hypothetical protein